ncbi:MAG: HAD family phosphatase [Streptomycetaceae bacterium]|nr:HAD family phosphatase [Streptomycetaceae bacterium]
MRESSPDVREWLHSRLFVVWDMDGGTRVAANGRRVVDGPILSLFNGHHGNRPGYWVLTDVPQYPNGFTAAEVNRELYEGLSTHRLTRSYAWDPDAADFMDHLRRAEQVGGVVRDVAYLFMTTLELNSVETSQLATGVGALTERLWRLGVRQGIATNNSIVAARSALRQHGLDDGRFAAICGRLADGSLHLKPYPDIVDQTVRQLGIPPELTGAGAFIEDSVKNVAAGRALGIPVVGITGHNPEKARQFREAGAAFTVDSVKDLWLPGRLGEARRSRSRALLRTPAKGLGTVGKLKDVPPRQPAAGDGDPGRHQPPRRSAARNPPTRRLRGPGDGPGVG